MAPEPQPDPQSVEDARVARTRNDVGRAALQVLTSEGWESMTHTRIAKAAGYSKTTLYTHWPSRLDLVTLALDCLGGMPHHTRTGNIAEDLAGELRAFRGGILDFALDRILIVLAQWGASVDEIAEIRDRIVVDGEGVLRAVLAEFAEGARLQAAVSMLSGVVVCPALMYGTVPTDEEIDRAVEIVVSALLTPGE